MIPEKSEKEEFVIPCSSELKLRVQEAADRQGITISQYVENVIKQEIEYDINLN